MSKVRFVSRLGFKIGLVIVAIEAAALALLGHFYLKRFSARVDESLLEALSKPGDLMSQGLLNLNMASDRKALEPLVGPGLEELMVLTSDGRIFASTRNELAGENIEQIYGFDPEWLQRARGGPVVEDARHARDSFLIRVSPVSVGSDRAAYLFVYLKMRTTSAEQEKAVLRRLFIAGSLATLAVTTAALLIFFRILFTRRLSRIASAVEHVGAGDLDARAGDDGHHDEIAQTRRGLDKMTTRLQSTITSLESTIGQLNEARRQLEEQSQFREAIINSTAEGIGVIHETGSEPTHLFTVWNHAAEKITGLDHHKINLHGLDSLMRRGPTGLGDFGKRLRKLSEGVSFRAEEWTLEDASGRTRTVLLSSAPLPIHNARPHHLLLIQDITSSKESEADRIRLERELAHAEKLKSLGILAGGIAHDFNNILTAILGHTDMAILETRPEDPRLDDLRAIEHATHRAAELARQMLAYSGKGRFVLTPVNLNALTHEITTLITASISKKITIAYDLDEKLPPFPGDTTQITQVLLNLITNAAEAIGDNPGTITIRTTTTDLTAAQIAAAHHTPDTHTGKQPCPGPHIRLEITDTGCGMDPATLERIFDPFFTTKFTGRGLGLAVVHGIIRGHNGLIQVTSRKGDGTTFTVHFPLTEILAPPTTQPVPTHAPTLDKSALILLADDEPSIRDLATQMLQQLGYTTLTAENGQQAIQIFQTHTTEIACVILDLTMPILDGEAAFDAIHRISPRTPIILSSGYSDQTIAERFATRPIASFLPKPYTLANLQERLGSALNHHDNASGI